MERINKTADVLVAVKTNGEVVLVGGSSMAGTRMFQVLSQNLRDPYANGPMSNDVAFVVPMQIGLSVPDPTPTKEQGDDE